MCRSTRIAAQASGIELKDVSHADAHPTDARLTAALLRVGGDPLHRSTLRLGEQKRRRRTLLEMTLHRIADLSAEVLQRVGLSVDRLPDGLGTEGAVVSFLHQKQQFVHDPPTTGASLASF